MRELFCENHPHFSSDAEPTLSDAQLVIAREYGFAGWPNLKDHVESIMEPPDDGTGELMEAIHGDDVARVRQLLENNPLLRKRINDPIGPFDSPPLNGSGAGK